MPTDADLLAAWREGRAAAGAELLSRYRGNLLRFFDLRVSLDAEDLAQRVLLVCAERLHEIRVEASFRSFLFGVARNVLLQHLRDRARDADVSDFSDVGSADPGPSPSRVVAVHQEQRILLRVVQELPIEIQLLLDLHYWEGMSAQEIGDAMGLSKTAITTRLYRARQDLRDAIRDARAPEPARASLVEDLDRWASTLSSLRAELGPRR
jgi:RNA polymerase sigma-70 factor (ECF subfamily)